MLILLASAGFIFRVWFAWLVPQPFVSDQFQYFIYALALIQKGLYADPVRLYGYPLVIVPIVYFFGANPWGWIILHAIMDTAAGLILYFLAKSLTANRLAAKLALALYLFNPFTSGYVGVLLTEITAALLVTVIFVFLWLFLRSRSLKALAATALLLGFLPQVRPSFFIFTLIAVPLIFYFIAKQAASRPAKIKLWLAALALYALPFSYTVGTNLLFFRQFAIQSVDNIFIRELYISNFIGRGLPAPDNSWRPEIVAAWHEFSTPRTKAERAAMNRKYLAKSLNIMAQNPVGFVVHHAGKLWYIWEKHFVYTYFVGSRHPAAVGAIYISNLLLLLAAAYGALKFRLKAGTDFARRWFANLTLLLWAYISVAHVFSTSEERFSLPAYPLVFLFAAIGIAQLYRRTTPRRATS